MLSRLVLVHFPFHLILAAVSWERHALIRLLVWLLHILQPSGRCVVRPFVTAFLIQGMCPPLGIWQYRLRRGSSALLPCCTADKRTSWWRCTGCSWMLDVCFFPLFHINAKTVIIMGGSFSCKLYPGGQLCDMRTMSGFCRQQDYFPWWRSCTFIASLLCLFHFESWLYCFKSFVFNSSVVVVVCLEVASQRRE